MMIRKVLPFPIAVLMFLGQVEALAPAARPTTGAGTKAAPAQAAGEAALATAGSATVSAAGAVGKAVQQAAARGGAALEKPAVPAPRPASGKLEEEAALRPAPVPAAAAGGMSVTVGSSEPDFLQMTVDRSLLIHTAAPLRRVAVSDPKVATATVLSPNQVLVHGEAEGETSLLLWDQHEHARNYVLQVGLDAGAAEAALQHLFPGDQIRVTASGRALVLSGHVSTPEVAEQAVKVAGGFATDVVSTMQSGLDGPQEVLLEVKFAEVDRSALTQLGVNIFSTGAANTIGATSTEQFGGFTSSKIQAPNVTTQGSAPNQVSGTIGGNLAGVSSAFGTSDLLNLFLFRSDINLGVIIRALQQKNLLQILAEPNLIAVSGKKASFLAGGEFPYPVVQTGTGYNAVTIQFKPFGVRLNFTPQIEPDGSIFLQVAPEVSALDFTNAVTLNGFVVPALSTRRADTSVDLRDGQSFVIAGLMDNRLTNLASKIPGLGDIPILGQLFRSKNYQKSNTELMVLVTARRVSPLASAPGLPKFPSPFLSPQQFDPAPKTRPVTGGRP